MGRQPEESSSSGSDDDDETSSDAVKEPKESSKQHRKSMMRGSRTRSKLFSITTLVGKSGPATGSDSRRSQWRKEHSKANLAHQAASRAQMASTAPAGDGLSTASSSSTPRKSLL